jgi:hypothetical protein
MRNCLRTLSAASLAAAFLLASASAAAAQQPGPPKRRQGPDAGPTIVLPPGQTAAPNEQPGPDGPGQTAAAKAPAPKWEYCAITSTGTQQKDRFSDVTGFARVRYFGGGGEVVEGASEDEAVANAMTKLGEDGWELVAIRASIDIYDGRGASVHSYFFKRPKSAQEPRQ